MLGGPSGEMWADSCLLTYLVPQKNDFFFLFLKKKTTQRPHICDTLEFGATSMSWLLRNDAQAKRWPLLPCLATEELVLPPATVLRFSYTSYAI